MGWKIEEKDVAMIKWTFDMQQCGISISLQQLKMKVAKTTQTKDTLFWNGMSNNSSTWY
jgi:hypothetical protein